MKVRRLMFCVLLVFMSGGYAQALTVNGPELTRTNIGWQDNGMVITALRDTMLDSFVFQNQGKADILRLTDEDSNILQTYNSPAGDVSHFVDVAWSLSAGETYYLIAQQINGDNGKWSSYSTFPVVNADIAVAGWVSDVFGTKGLGDQYWFHFNGITTEGTAGKVPEPATMLLLGLGLVGLAGMRRKLHK